MNEREEFYIGYLPTAPRGLGKWLRAVCFALLGVVMLVALALVFGLKKLPLSMFEFGQVRDFTGIVQANPYPTLLVKTGQAFAHYWLVAEGKHGVDMKRFDGQQVTLQGTRIARDGVTMIEVVNGSVQAVSATAAVPLPTEEFGTFTLVGEIVDSKCYLGVMNPGETKVHRECAVRCISGGIPPLLIARDAAGNKVALQLVSASGARVNAEVLELVAEPVKITGQVRRTGEQLVLQADPKTYQRVP